MKSNKKKGWIAIIVAILISVLVLVIRVFASAKGWSNSAVRDLEEAEVTEQPIEEETIVVNPPEEVISEGETIELQQEEVVQDEVIWHFYNLDLQDDDDKLNDYNFGPNPILESISLEKVKEAIKGKKASDTVKVEEIIEMLNAEEIQENQIQRMHDDPKLGAADMAWMDSIAGTRYLGTFYSAAKEQWDVAMNDAADAWIEDEESYNQTLNAFEKWLNSATNRYIEYRDSGLDDQMYMNPYTVSGVPDIIVMETDNHEGWFIVYEFTIKETKKIEVAYRIDCGYQPTNVSKIMKITAQKNPNNQTGGSDPKPSGGTTPSGGSGGGSGGGGGGGGGGGNTPTPPGPTPPGPTPPTPPTPTDPKKDPTQGTQVLPNDDSGPGKATMDPSDPNKSTAEQASGSNNMSQEEYQKAIEDLQSANDTTKQGGDDNTPSYTPPQATEETSGSGSSVTVDNNGDNGTGNGGIDKPTETSGSSVANDKAGGSWDGPSD